MRWVIVGAVLAVLAAGLGLWLAGGDRVITAWALDGQREAQSAMAGALRRLRGGETSAVFALAAVCFIYGFFHAVGPGHGKLLVAGYGAAREIGPVRLSMVALISSLAQGVTAIVLVGAGVWLLGLGREQMTDMAERLFAPLSFAAIALIGLWLVWRGARGLWRLSRDGDGPGQHHPHHPHDHHDHDHHHHHHGGHGDGDLAATCGQCGHAHGPDPQALAQATSAREVAALVGAVAIRPCTGALFVLILTAQLGVFWAGIAGAFAMALGTASVTIAVALASTSLRKGVLVGFVDSPALARAQPLLELSIGALVAAAATSLALALM